MKLSALAVAVLFSANAWAGLGKINVRSYLGETFRAEINLTDVNAAELSSARVGLAGMDTFRDLNVDYSGILSSLKFSVEPSGRGAIVRVSSSAPINEPYLRFVVEARTSSGRSVREYTVLLDPIDYQVNNKPSFVQSLPKAAPSLASPYRGNVAREGVVAPRRTSADSLYVAPGATLNTLAAQVRPQGASLEQTMAALVKNNPSAFIAGDPNRIKAAVNLKVPPAAKIRAIASSEARNLLAPASALAANSMPPAAQASPEQPPAAAPKPAAAAPQAAQPVKGGEVLKLMAPETSAPSDEKLSEVEQQVASRDQALKDAEKRIATLEAQIKALQNSHEIAKPAAGSAAKAGEAAGPSLVDSLVDNLPLVGGGAAIALLAALGVVVARRRRQAPSLSSALKLSSGNAGAVLGSGASSNINLQGGASAIGGGHSFMANFTQSVGAIDTAEVDPIAEAEVYIAYGRDAQAEEILKDALSRDPSRHEVRLKLMEIHAARQDKEGFESLARELYAAFDGKGPHWAKAAAMGAVLDPGNPLYQLLDTTPGASAPAVAPAAAIDLDHELFGQPPAPASPPMPAENVAAPREPAKAPSAPVTPSVPAESDDPLRAALFAEAPPSGLAEEANPGNMLDFDLDAAFDLSAKKPEAEATQDDPAASGAMQENLLDFDFNLDSMLSEPSGKAGQQGKADTAPDLGLEETGSAGFEALYEGMLGAESAPEAASLEGLSVNDDPLSTKLDLAKVYLDMGDKDGAKEVLEDLLSEAQGGLKSEAEQLLAKIGS
ncbi:FimV/HubP family polar landmark protein [Pseudogulbenkiania ferrooxidans]|uniref:Putative transmembrane protein n=1 Tax=Pseudogulbenkiania ferrooxidans 2002 TaxID=279714 RepID=B9Z2X8_9NEIS|nr:FimV/HubP family polar landmark protein [Pseudogulbenkiania ferrooxidans]EEG08931.1 putative transmembrane protein [Pseudogulbenkiania ferrooxidans 2002]